ncbi:MAG: amino acid adenylation domain-containing protein, partial [Gemmatimonadaceae bacterium]
MQLLREWGLPRHVDRVPECVNASFEAQAARAPDAIAIVAENGNGDLESLSYAELNRRANRLANVLRRLGVAPESRVAFCLERTPSLPVALLGIVKAGGAYVPLDPSYPVERLQYMLADSAPRLLLTSRRRGARVPWTELVDGLGVEIVDVDELEARGRLEQDDDASLADVAVTPEHLAYIIYTSGSTGRPKGSLIPHRSIGGYVDKYLELRDGPRAETWLQYSSLSWDASTLELWAPLVRGWRCVLCPPSADIESNIDMLGALIAAHRVTTLWMTAALFDVVIDTAPEMLRPLEVLIIGGQQLSPVHVARAKERLGRTRLVNGYGPSECTVFSTCHVFSDDEIRAPIPIGRPVGDRRCYVIDGGGEPTPLGVTGELCIGGAGVARGYLNRAALTAERFIPDPFGPSGSRLYRSGDLARWRADGEIEYLGRADAQVKIRGFRVELGEIEALLNMRHDVRQAVVIARSFANRDPQLVAYCVPTVEHAARIRSEDWRDFLSTRLPMYMVPAAYVVLDALPFTANGKLDRRALPAPDEAAFAVSQYEAPASATERRLADVWSALLGVERVGRRDEFFALGGHSLLAVQLMSRLRQMLGVEVTVATLFRAPVLADLAAQLDTARRVEARPIVPVDRDKRGVPIGAPLSFAQRRLWFLEQLGGLGPAYHVPWAARLVGALDVAALEQALRRIVARHEALRTTYQAVDGAPRQVVTPASEAAFALATTDLSAVGEAERHAALREAAIADATAPFDLERGSLVRGRLVRLGAAEHVLLLTMHHVVCDGWSLSVFSAELSALYAAARSQSSFSREIDPLPPLAIQYADYAAWQMQAAEEPGLRAQAAYWLSTLSGAPNRLELPTDRPRPAMHSYAGALVPLALDEALTAKLAALSARFETTMFMTVLAGWAAVLSRLSGQSDVVIGTPTANRTRTELEGLIGLFVNTLALRIDLSGGPTVRNLLTRVRDRALEAQEHQDVPFEQVVELLQPTRHLSQSAVFQALFVWQNTPPVRFTMPDLTATLLPGLSAGADVVGAVDADTIGRAVSGGHVPAKFDVTLTLREDGARLTGHLVYATALWERTTIERYAGYLTRVLTAMTADPEVLVADLPLLDAGELAEVLAEWNPAVPAAGADELDTTVPCIHECFEAHVRRTPDAVAAVYGDEQLTYAELDARAARLACRLTALGVRPETRVALCLERSLAMVIGLLGVLKAGGAYVPLDPKSPAERLRFMVDDSAPVALLTDAASEAATHGVSGGRPVLRIDASSS